MKPLLVLALLSGIPRIAVAQSAIAGSVKDTSGAPIAGVRVEANSPALIEKIRTTVTDGAGRYRVEDLRPGTYAVRFSGQGFSPYRQEGVVLAGSLTVTVDAELTIGPLAETVSVTNDVTPVDVHTAKRDVTLSGETVRS